MPRRAASLAILVLLIGALSAAPAQAKCCPLEKLVISGPGFEGFSIVREQLDDQLSQVEQGNLYWPVLNAPFKGDHRPEGDLGPGYRVTYVLAGLDGEPIQVREIVYLEADPPVAFVPKGQTHELYPGDVRKVPWGWRPFPARAANAVIFMLDESRTVSLAGDVVTGTRRSWAAGLGAAIVGVVVAIGGLWSFVRVRRRRLAAAG